MAGFTSLRTYLEDVQGKKRDKPPHLDRIKLIYDTVMFYRREGVGCFGTAEPLLGGDSIWKYYWSYCWNRSWKRRKVSTLWYCRYVLLQGEGEQI